MNEIREVAGAAMYQAIPRLAGGSSPTGRKLPDLFHKKIHVVNFFVKKKKEVPCCRRRIGRLGLAPGRNWQDRVTPVTMTEVTRS
jgi:hypothetical protein